MEKQESESEALSLTFLCYLFHVRLVTKLAVCNGRRSEDSSSYAPITCSCWSEFQSCTLPSINQQRYYWHKKKVHRLRTDSRNLRWPEIGLQLSIQEILLSFTFKCYMVLIPTVKQMKQYSVLIKCIFFVWVHILPNDPILFFSLFSLSPNSHQSPAGYCVDLHLSGFCARFTCVCMQLFSSPPCLLYLDFISSFSCYSDSFEQNKICFKKTYQESFITVFIFYQSFILENKEYSVSFPKFAYLSFQLVTQQMSICLHINENISVFSSDCCFPSIFQLLTIQKKKNSKTP